MRSNIIEDLRPFYCKHTSQAHRILKDTLLKKICDGYFIEDWSFARIAMYFGLSISQVKRLFIRGCGKIIRNR